jgi:hypothetical protein
MKSVIGVRAARTPSIGSRGRRSWSTTRKVNAIRKAFINALMRRIEVKVHSDSGRRDGRPMNA